MVIVRKIKALSFMAAAMAAAASAGAGTLAAGFLSLQSGNTLEQKLARAGIRTDQVRYIV